MNGATGILHCRPRFGFICFRLFLLGALAFATGCHSAYVEATVTNATGGPLTLLEVDYPSASFGTESLAAGTDFHYRFKILGSGSTKVLWTDAQHKEHNGGGPDLHEGEEGPLKIVLTASGATWNSGVHPAR